MSCPSRIDTENPNGWKLLTTPPSRSGRYIVGHRGHAKIIWYLHPDGDYLPGPELGWQKNPRDFGATHYMPLPKISDIQSEAADIDFEARGMTRLDPKKPRPQPAPAETPTPGWMRILTRTARKRKQRHA